MRDILAPLTAGLGIFFLGLHLVSTGLQESTSRTLRALLKRSTNSRYSCALVGIVAGVVMQSTSAVATVLGSMATSGLITLAQAVPIVAFANVGTTALVFAGALDVRTAVLFAVGVSGITFSMAREFKWKALSSVALGIALLLYGGDLVTASASGVQRTDWFAGILQSLHGSTILSFALGVLVSFLAQTTTAAALMSVALANARLLEIGEAITMIYGANLGSTLVRMLLTRGVSGTLRQVSHFQDFFKIGAMALFIPLFYVERGLGVPLVAALAASVTASTALQLAFVNFLFNASMAIITTVFSAPLTRIVTRRWPSSVVESLSVPEYLSLDAVHDPETAIDLLEKEQMRVLRRTREFLSTPHSLMASQDRIDPAALHRSFLLLFVEMEHFQTALVGQHLDPTTSERLGNVQARQKLLELIEDSMQQTAVSVTGAPRSGKLDALIGNFFDALDFLLMFAADAARTLERGRAEILHDLTSDRGEMMGSLRSLYLAPGHALSADDKALLLRLTTLFERVTWMLQRYADLLLKNL